MYRNLQIVIVLALAGTATLSLPAKSQAAPDAAATGTINAKQVKELEKSAITAADHRRLAAYYQAQADITAKKLADAHWLDDEWAGVNRWSKQPDPYPHTKRLIGEYSDQLVKYHELADNHLWEAIKIEAYEKYGKPPASNESGFSAGPPRVLAYHPKQ